MDKIWLNHYPQGVAHEIDVTQYRSLNELIEGSVASHSPSPAFSNFGVTLSYGEFDDLSKALAAYLQHKLGLQKGERIAMMLPNLHQYAVAIYAALRIGLVIVNVNPLYTARELMHQLNDADTNTIIIWADVCATLAEIIEATGIEHIICSQTDDLLHIDLPPRPVDGRLEDAISFKAALDAGLARSYEKVDVNGRDLAFLQYTGGTTGLSKGAMLTHENIIANLLQISATFAPLKTDEGEIFITALPLYHIYALTCNYFSCIHEGGLNVFITNPRDMPAFVGELSNWRFTRITGVNTLYNGLIHTPGFDKLDFSRLLITSAGGMALQTAVSARWHEITGRVMIEGYGLSETSPVLTSNPVNIDKHVGSVGLPLPSTDLSLRDDNGDEVEIGEAGELCAKGPQIMAGYWRDEEATAKTMTKDGYFKTGDIARADERGFFYIVDRKKDMILVSGFNVFPNEVEAVIAAMDGVLECACIGVPDERSGEAVALFVVTEPGAAVDDQKIKHWCEDKLAQYKTPSIIEYVDTLPKSNVGKILRRQIREHYHP